MRVDDRPYSNNTMLLLPFDIVDVHRRVKREGEAPKEVRSTKASINDVRAQGGVAEKWTTVLISCVIMYM